MHGKSRGEEDGKISLTSKGKHSYHVITWKGGEVGEGKKAEDNGQ